MSIADLAEQLKNDIKDVYQAGNVDGYNAYLTAFLCADIQAVNVSEKILNSTTIIKKYAFYSQPKIKTIIIPEGITNIDDYAFYYATGLASLKLPTTLKRIGAGCFRNCYNCKSIDLPEGLQIIEQHAFSWGNHPNNLIIPASVTTINNRAFENTPRNTITFLGKPNKVAADAFNQCTSVTDIYCPWYAGQVAGAPWGAVNATIHYKKQTEYDITSSAEAWFEEPINYTYTIKEVEEFNAENISVYLEENTSKTITIHSNKFMDYLIPGNKIYIQAETPQDIVGDGSYILYPIEKCIVKISQEDN